MYQLIIIGGGPAATAAGVYAARKKLKTLLIAESFGGQSIVSDDIQNWVGEPHLSGFELAQKFEVHLRSLGEDIEIKMPLRVVKVDKIETNKDFFFQVKTADGMVYESKTVILATGGRRRKLNVPGENKFEGRGVTYCSTCDAPLFKNKKVAVIGGGNAGLEAVQDLTPYASEIYLLEAESNLRGDVVIQETIKKEPKLKEVILNAEVLEILGDEFVTGLRYRNKITKEERKLEVDGVFVEIGSVPNSEIVKDLVALNNRGEVIVDAKHATTSQPGIFAAGDVTDDPYKQNNIAAGDGVKAALAAYNFLTRQVKK